MRHVCICALILLSAFSCHHKKSKGQPSIFQGQFDQDRYVYENFFRDKNDGIFVDIGAYDGITQSNSLFFEKQLGWQGLCVEPHPKKFAKLQKRRSCICVKGCVSNEPGQSDFMIVDGCEVLSGLVDQFDPRQRDIVNRELERRGREAEFISVPCFRLADLLESHNIDRIDFLSVDTEGAELSVLKSIDFQKTPVHVITVENLFDDPSIRDLLEAEGFVYTARLGLDEVYRNPAFLDFLSGEDG